MLFLFGFSPNKVSINTVSDTYFTPLPHKTHSLKFHNIRENDGDNVCLCVQTRRVNACHPFYLLPVVIPTGEQRRSCGGKAEEIPLSPKIPRKNINYVCVPQTWPYIKISSFFNLKNKNTEILLVINKIST